MPRNKSRHTSTSENKENIAIAVSSINAIAPTPRQIVPGKHPLESRWALWYLKADRNKEWEDCLKMISFFDTVEDFWALYNHIQTPTGLVWGSDFYIFKEGIKPMWEDPQNISGGRWLITVDKLKRGHLLDKYWMELLMMVVGEQFEDKGEFICGAVCNIRNKGDKVSLWTRDATRDDVNTRIGQLIRARLNLPDLEPIRYEVHKDASHRTSSLVKPRIILPAKVKEPKESQSKEPKESQSKEPKESQSKEQQATPAAATAVASATSTTSHN